MGSYSTELLHVAEIERLYADVARELGMSSRPMDLIQYGTLLSNRRPSDAAHEGEAAPGLGHLRDVVRELQGRTLESLERSASDSAPDAMLLFDALYLSLLGCTEDLPRANQILHDLSGKEYPPACVQEALNVFDGIENDRVERQRGLELAVRWLERAARYEYVTPLSVAAMCMAFRGGVLERADTQGGLLERYPGIMRAIAARVAEIAAEGSADSRALTATWYSCSNPRCGVRSSHEPEFRHCIRCNERYCGRVCQRADWPAHKGICAQRVAEALEAGAEDTEEGEEEEEETHEETQAQAATPTDGGGAGEGN
jgi:hypothetical protein